MKRLISHNATPTTINATTRFSKGMFLFSLKRLFALDWPLAGGFSRRGGSRRLARLHEQGLKIVQRPGVALASSPVIWSRRFKRSSRVFFLLASGVWLTASRVRSKKRVVVPPASP